MPSYVLGSEVVDSESMAVELLGLTVAAIVWTAYLMRSKKVKELYCASGRQVVDIGASACTSAGGMRSKPGSVSRSSLASGDETRLSPRGAIIAVVLIVLILAVLTIFKQ